MKQKTKTGAAICALGTSNPPRYAKQREVYHFLDSHFTLQEKERELYRRVLIDGPIYGRYVGVHHDGQAAQHDPDLLNERFHHFATKTAADAAREALCVASLKPADIGAIIVSTCTGYLCPGLSSYVAEELELSPNATGFDLVGMGCGAALPNLRCASGLVSDSPGCNVLSVMVEICSATMFMGPDPDLIVSNSIFGDGAAAAVVSDAAMNPKDSSVRIVDFESLHIPQYREDLRYRMESGRLRNSLSPRVPIIAAKAVKQVCETLLERNDLSKDDVDRWIVHPGGTRVLDRIEKRLALTPDSLKYSRDAFREYGNMSSPSVLFVLDQAIRDDAFLPGQRAILTAFGAGFTAYAALVERV